MNAALPAAIDSAIGAASGVPFSCTRQVEQGGGCINRGFGLVGADGRRFFAKLNHADQLDMFEAEAAGLQELAGAEAIRVPRPIACGSGGNHAFLILEWLELGGREQAVTLGRRLAALHGRVHGEFGWRRSNYIGSTPQRNTPMQDWPEFFRSQRLQPQLDLACRNAAPGKLIELGELLMARLPGLFPGYTPVASLLHGDLWGGNYGYVDAEPVLFDPAIYYGDREADLAMTELFGGFPPAFHAAYREAWPPDPGYGVRKRLYNLYHVINHFNLFGGGYAAQAEGLMGRLLAELR